MGRAREVLENFRRLIREQHTLTTRRNAARTFHDFLKLLLRRLATPEEEKFLGEVDIKKRFTYLTSKFSDLKPFTDLIEECKSPRDRVEHSDAEAPEMSVLERWGGRAESLLKQVESCQELANKKEAQNRSARDLPRFVLLGEFEEVERLGSILSEKLADRGLSGEEIDAAVSKFRGLYEPHYSWNDAKLDSASDFEIADAIAIVARKNGMFGQILDTAAEILAADPSVKRQTIN